MAGTSPAMTKKRIAFRRLELENADCIFSQALSLNRVMADCLDPVAIGIPEEGCII
jgi:hypothetical protein